MVDDPDEQVKILELPMRAVQWVRFAPLLLAAWLLVACTGGSVDPGKPQVPSGTDVNRGVNNGIDKTTPFLVEYSKPISVLIVTAFLVFVVRKIMGDKFAAVFVGCVITAYVVYHIVKK
jgi:hypothetical protein